VTLPISDHHDFTDADIEVIKSKAENKVGYFSQRLCKIKGRLPVAQLFFIYQYKVPLFLEQI
jgi:hypothetical protein